MPDSPSVAALSPATDSAPASTAAPTPREGTAPPDLLATDLVDRRFTREGVDQLWVTHITEHPTRVGEACAVALDVCLAAGGWLVD